MIDRFFDYKLGVLEYRSVRFETEKLDMENYQGNAVVNYTSADVPYTRIIEHKHFNFGKQPVTIISREYSSEWKKGDEPYYPVNNEKNAVFTGSMRSLQKMRKMFYLAEDSVSTNIMIWIRLLRQHLKCVIMSYRKSV